MSFFFFLFAVGDLGVVIGDVGEAREKIVRHVKQMVRPIRIVTDVDLDRDLLLLDEEMLNSSITVEKGKGKKSKKLKKAAEEEKAKEDERKKIEEEERKKAEEEEKRKIEEEERRKAEEEERKRMEEERQRMEEERQRIEEEKKRIEEERKRIEEEWRRSQMEDSDDGDEEEEEMNVVEVEDGGTVTEVTVKTEVTEKENDYIRLMVNEAEALFAKEVFSSGK